MGFGRERAGLFGAVALCWPGRGKGLSQGQWRRQAGRGASLVSPGGAEAEARRCKRKRRRKSGCPAVSQAELPSSSLCVITDSVTLSGPVQRLQQEPGLQWICLPAAHPAPVHGTAHSPCTQRNQAGTPFCLAAPSARCPPAQGHRFRCASNWLHRKRKRPSCIPLPHPSSPGSRKIQSLLQRTSKEPGGSGRDESSQGLPYWGPPSGDRTCTPCWAWGIRAPG